MANTYTQLYIHFVFAVQNRNSLIFESWEKELYYYMSGIIEQQEHKLYAINGMPDHLHVLISMNPEQSPSKLMYHLKRNSSLWINRKHMTPGRFSWQEGFGAFSYGKSQITRIAEYIAGQKYHHSKRNFHDEYIEFLRLYEIDYDERYLYKPIVNDY